MSLFHSEEFNAELKRCKFFRLKPPRGGQYNDGFELLGKLVFHDGIELIKALDALMIEYTLCDLEPKQWCPPPLILGTDKHWIVYQNYCECFGFKTRITIGATDFSIEFNLNSTSHYDVVLEDVTRAIAFEQALISNGVISI